jgi:oxygen-independent coproporphyrinogen-3 oxidase
MIALKKHLEYELKNQNISYFKSVFIGGGTPSCVDSKYYEPIFKLLNNYTDKNTEITTEANPNSATLIWQKSMFNMGVNRISFGVQSFDNKKLEFLARNHAKTHAIEAIQNANKIGFKHINCDIIYDTALDTKELIANDLQIISTLPIDHISAYSLTLEEGTKFFNKSNVKVEDENMARYIFDSLKDQGFDQYEISNFAKCNDSRCKHNLGYWEYENYLGIGCGAVGCLENKRTYTLTDVQEYINKPIEYDVIETLSNNDILVEKTLLGLRSSVGCELNNYDKNQLLKIDILIENKKIYTINNKFYSSDYMLADEIALYIVDDAVN